MVTQPIYIADIIRDAVSAFTPTVLPIIKANEAAILGRTNIDTINFQKGHQIELIQTLAQLDASPQLKNLKYPLIWLVQDFKEKRGRKAGIYATTNLSIVIAHQTVDTYKATERDVNVFRPVLYPIYYALLEALAVSDFVNDGSSDLMMHDKEDKYFWGTQSIGGTIANQLNDYVDAIEISNLNLTILYNNC